MALEYTLYGAADVGTEELLSFLAEAVGGTVTEDRYVQADGLQVTAYRVSPGEEASAAALFGFTHRVTATFRFSNTAPPPTQDRNIVLMTQAALRFLDTHPGDAVLLFNQEEVVLQRLTGVIALNSDWEEWADVAGMRPLAAGREFRPLSQPLL